MNALSVLISHGFEAERLSVERGAELYRIRTPHGWTYERFREATAGTEAIEWCKLRKQGDGA